MNATLMAGRPASVQPLEVRLLSEEELLGIEGGGMFAAGLALAGCGTVLVLAGVALGVLVYVLVN